MSRQVYRLNNSDNEDYLTFGSPATEVAPPLPAAKLSKPRITNRTPVIAAITRARESISAPVHNDLDDDANDDEVKPGKGKKIALKSVQEHQQLINQLNAFSCSARFSPVLKECGIVVKDLRLKSVAELRELRERVRACCANSGSGGGIVSSGILGACGQIEALAPARLINLDGYKEAVESNPEFASLCEMIEIDSSFLRSMSPMQKMVMCLGTTAMSVGAMNRKKGEAAHATATLVDSLRAQQQQQQSAVRTGTPIVSAASVPKRPSEEVRSY